MLASQIAPRALRWVSRQLQKRIPYSPSNAYLEGPFAPVAQERTEMALRMSGDIPRELNGLFTRIGPNPIRVDNPGAYHWFSGDGMVHGVRFRDGRALWYRNRWVGTDSAAQLLGRPQLPGGRHGVSDTVNTNLVVHAGRIWALNEAGALPVELDGSLESIRHSFFEGPVSRAFTAHPHTDPATGELHAICYEGGPARTVHHVVVDARGNLTKNTAIPLASSPMIHDCALTRSSVLLFDLPVTFSGRAFLGGAGIPYRWDPEQGARVGLVPRHGSERPIRWCRVDPCFVYHACNAYDRDDGCVVVDVVVHARTFDRPRNSIPDYPITFERWTLDPAAGTVARTVLSERSQEFPRFDERLTGKPYRYAYTVGYRGGSVDPQPLFKYDLHTGDIVSHDYGPGRITGEAVFVPRTEHAAEDDGWLLSYVYDVSAGMSDLVIVNASDVSGTPQAVIHLPAPVPMGFHSSWIADRAGPA